MKSKLFSITLKNNNFGKNKYSVFVTNNSTMKTTESRFSHFVKARKYVKDCFEEENVTVFDKITEPDKKIKVSRWQ